MSTSYGNALSNKISTRKLYSASHQCPAGCKYCFAKWTDTYLTQPVFGSETIDGDSSVIYPCCDGELFVQGTYIDEMKKLSESTNKMYLSISTKCGLDQKTFNAIADFNSFLVQNQKGFVKLSISLATKTMIDVIEPGTLSYNSRLELLKQIVETGLPTSITLKSVIPFVSNTEYFDIIDDCSKIVDKLLVGGLYINEKSMFFKQFIQGKFRTVLREVSWLIDHPIWPYVDQDEKIIEISTYAAKLNMQVFDTDVDLIRALCIEKEG
ncbi:MAG: radical SAM protein [Acidaminococcaceae bacterium]|nr:radical SAM protein [Acidaminococcaceae bacterium]